MTALELLAAAKELAMLDNTSELAELTELDELVATGTEL